MISMLTVVGVKRIILILMFIVVTFLFLERHRQLEALTGRFSGSREENRGDAGNVASDVQYLSQDNLYETVVEKIHDNAYAKPPNEKCKSREPDVIIIGVEKCGTRELLDFLSMHPNVKQKRNPRSFSFFEHHSSDFSKSKEGMPCLYSDQIGVVKTDNYFNMNVIPERLHRFNPDLKMILMVRDPIDRIISHFTYHKIKAKEEYDMSKDLRALIIDYNGELKYKTRVIQQSTYDEALERYLQFFKLEQILIIENREFSMDPVATLQKVEDFLALPKFISAENFAKNPANGFFCPVMEGRAYCYDSSRGRHAINNQVDTPTMNTMLNYFTPKNEKFFDLIGKTFTWKQTKSHRQVHH